MSSPARFKVLACGRRWGKSLLAVRACWDALHAGAQTVWYVAPTFRMADLHWRTLQRLLRGAAVQFRQGERRAVTPDGREIAFRSADNPDHLRGAGLDFLVVDEAAFVPNGHQVWAEALRPSLSDRGGHALVISTPRGRNWFHDLYVRGQDPAEPEYAAFCQPTAANPLIAAGEIAAARRELPQRVFEQEYEARFLEDAGSVFEHVAELADGTCPEPYASQFVIGVDWAKREDFTVFCVLDTQSSRVVALERCQQLDYTVQTARLRQLCDRWQPRLVHAERNSIGEPLLEQLLAEGLPVRGFMTTAASKRRLIDELALAFAERALRLPNDPVLIGELCAYTVELTAGGNLRYTAPPGLHDDTVMALALAWAARGLGRAEACAAWL